MSEVWTSIEDQLVIDGVAQQLSIARILRALQRAGFERSKIAVGNRIHLLRKHMSQQN